MLFVLGLYGPPQFTEEDIELFRKSLKKENEVSESADPKEMKLQKSEIKVIKEEDTGGDTTDEDNMVDTDRTCSKLSCSSCGVSCNFMNPHGPESYCRWFVCSHFRTNQNQVYFAESHTVDVVFYFGWWCSEKQSRNLYC